MKLGNWIEAGRMDELARQDTPIHRIDARAKAAATVAFIIILMSFPRYEVSALTPFFLYPFLLIALGRIPAGFIFRKILVAAPFAFIIGIFNPFFDRQTVLVMGSFAISGGWLSFASIIIRFALTVGAVLATVACTGMYNLCNGLERMGLPRIFAGQLLFLYRYLFVITDEGARMMRALELRSSGLSSLGARVYGPLVGHLFLRSLARAERIYQAMVARGFSGEIKTIRQTAFQPADWIFLTVWTAFFVMARIWNLAGLIGGAVTGKL